MRLGQVFEVSGKQISRSLAGRFGFTLSRQFAALVIVGLTLSLTIAACSNNPSTSTSPSPGQDQQAQKELELTLVGYAIPKAAHDAIIPKFQERWQKEQGQAVTFRQSYGGSGSQSRAVIDGLEADVVHLAVGVDVNKLVEAELVADDWQKRVPNNGTVAKTVVSIITREGNPKNIKSFGDLTRNDVKWVTADPKTSGGARWNFLALWSYVLKTGGNDAKAKAFTTQAYRNVVVLAKDARESTDAFNKQGQGDALLNYENEVILAQQKGEKLDYITPDTNFAVDTPIAVVDKNVDKHGTRKVAEAFVQFLFTPEAQAEFVKLGYRPLEADGAKQKEVAKEFPPVKTLGSVEDFGGWNDAQQKFFADKAIFDQIQSEIKR